MYVKVLQVFHSVANVTDICYLKWSIFMTKKEANERIKKIKAYTKELKKNKKASREFLIDAGIYTKNGNLKKVYK